MIGKAFADNKSVTTAASPTASGTKEILSLQEAADYLKLSEKSIKQIILQEEKALGESGSFSGMMFPYLLVKNDYVFSKKSLDAWMKEVTEHRTVYSNSGINRN